MDRLHQRYGNWALVAGAAEGIGEGFSTFLAEKGFNLVMADRNKAALKMLAENLSGKFSVEIRQVTVDLKERDSAESCLSIARETGCRLMIFVAAYSKVTPFLNLGKEDLESFIDVNCRTLLHLVHGFSASLAARGQSGGIILVSSLAGLIGPKYVATYAATKSFSIRLAEALHGEFREREIDIMACASGTVATPTYLLSKPDLKRMKPPMMESIDVARFALSRLGKKPLCIPGFGNRLNYFLLRDLLPRWIAKKLVDDAMEKMYGVS